MNALIGEPLLALALLSPADNDLTFPGTQELPRFASIESLINLGETSRALSELNRFISTNRGNAFAFSYRGCCHAAMGQWDLAKNDFSKALVLCPTNSAVLVNRGNANRMLGALSNAVADFDSCLRLNPTNGGALIARAAVNDLLNRYPEVESDTTRALHLNPRDEWAFCLRAHSRFMRGQFEDADADYRKGLEINPENDSILNGFAWLLATCPVASLRDGKQAMKLAQRACELTKWNDWSRIDTFAAALAECGQFAEAVRQQKKAMALLQSESEEYRALSRTLDLYQCGKPNHEGNHK